MDRLQDLVVTNFNFALSEDQLSIHTLLAICRGALSRRGVGGFNRGVIAYYNHERHISEKAVLI